MIKAETLDKSQGVTTQVEIVGRAELIICELCAVIDSMSKDICEALYISKSKAYELVLTDIAERLADDIKKPK